MTKRSVWVALAAVAVACSAADQGLDKRSFLSASPELIDFGDAMEGERVERALVLENEGGRSLELVSVVIVDDERLSFTLVSGGATTVPAGGRVTVSLSYRGRAPEAEDVARLRITSDAANTRELFVELRGRTRLRGDEDAGAPPDASAGPACPTVTQPSCTGVTRYDPTFGASGIAQLAMRGTPGALDESFEEAHAAALDRRGRILIGGDFALDGSWDFALVRLSPNGTLDPSFGDRGRVLMHGFGAPALVRGVAVDSRDRVVVAVALDLAAAGGVLGLARFDAAGRPDPSFGGTGFVHTPLSARNYSFWLQRPLAIQSGDRVVLAGTPRGDADASLAFARYTEHGALDPSFGVGGVTELNPGAAIDVVTAIRALPDDSLVGAASMHVEGFAGQIGAVRLRPDGAVDRAFGGGRGWASTRVPRGGRSAGLTIAPDGKIVVVGCTLCDLDFTSPNDVAVVRFLPSGDLDPCFGVDGVKVLSFHEGVDLGIDVLVAGPRLLVAGAKGAQRDDGKMLVAGLLDDGTLDTCFGDAGAFTGYPVVGHAGGDWARTLVPDANGGVLVVGATAVSGFSDFAAYRLLP